MPNPLAVIVAALIAGSNPGGGGRAQAQAPPATAPAPAPPAGAAAPQPDCRGAEYRAFDFWIGVWDVTAQGKPAGTNRIEAVLDGCALVESWTSASGGKGTSLNFYDRATGAWYQAWTDARGGALRLKGGPDGGAMVMRSEVVPSRGGGSVVHRITWSPEADRGVRQLWESSSDEGKTWTVAFDGRYVRRP